MNRNEQVHRLAAELAHGIMVTSKEFRAQFSLDFIETVPEPQWPPAIWQYSPDWSFALSSHPDVTSAYLSTGLLFCLYSLAVWAGCEDSLPNFEEELRAGGAFVGGECVNPGRVTAVYPELGWILDSWLPRGNWSSILWTTTPADLGLLAHILDMHPCCVEVDYLTHPARLPKRFVLATKYHSGQNNGGVDDDLTMMDPLTGGFTSVLTYFNPRWLSDGSMPPGVTKVQRTLTRALVWKVL